MMNLLVVLYAEIVHSKSPRLQAEKLLWPEKNKINMASFLDLTVRKL